MEPQENSPDASSSNVERRSIRDLRINRPQAARPERRVSQPQVRPTRTQDAMQDMPKQKRSFSKLLVPGAALLGGALLLFVLLPIIFPDATVRVTPKATDGLPKTTLTASFEPESQLPYSITSWSVEEKVDLPATTTLDVTEKASGKIVISNANTVDQRLIKNTRFETADGKIYRIRDSVVVPAGEKGGAEGTLEVTVFADEGGATYNVDSASFTLPGLKGSDLFSKVTAKTVSSISGGFSGQRKTADESLVASTRSELRKKLEEKQALPEDMTKGTFPLMQTLKSNFESLPDIANGDTVTITEKMTLQVITVPATKFAHALATEAGSHVESDDVLVTNADALTVSVANTAIESAQAKKELIITVDGVPRLVWNIDVQQLQKDLAGASRDGVTGIQKRYTNIERAVTTIRPFWRNTLPGNYERIEVVIESDTTTE